MEKYTIFFTWCAILFAHIIASCGAYVNYKGYQLLRATPTTELQLHVLKSLEQTFLSDLFAHNEFSLLEFWREPHSVNQSTDIFVAPQLKASLHSYLKRNSLQTEVMMNDVGRIIQEEYGRNHRKSSIMLQPKAFGPDDDPSRFDLNEYHSFDEVIDYLEALSKRYKAFVQLKSLGSTFEGRELVYLKFGYPSDGPKKALFMDAGIHAREWVAPAMALYFINQLVTRYEFTPLLEDIDIYVLPMANPDGYEYSRTTDRMWRKTRSGPSENGCYGADPNRNFPHFWCVSGASHESCSYQVYCGSEALSEIECRSLANFLARNNDTIMAYVTLHSFGNVIIHPFGHAQGVVPENVGELKRAGHDAARAIRRAGGPSYGVGTTMELIHYTASGASDDYAKTLGIKFVYTVELTDTQFGFVLPSALLKPTARHIMPAFVSFAEEVWNLDDEGHTTGKVGRKRVF